MNKKNITWRMRIGTPPGGLRTIVPEEMQQFRSFTDQGTDHFVWRGHPEAGGDFEVEMTLSPGTHGLNAARIAFRNYSRKDHVEEVCRCRDKGIYTQVYINGVCWDMDTGNWQDGGEEGAVVNRDGQPHSCAFNVYTKHRLVWECGEAEPENPAQYARTEIMPYSFFNH